VVERETDCGVNWSVIPACGEGAERTTLPEKPLRPVTLMTTELEVPACIVRELGVLLSPKFVA
jgi:hypothetical protein